MHFQTFRLHPPHAPLLRQGFWLRADLAPDSPFGLSAVLRTSFTARSLVSRIRPYRVCVAGVTSPAVLRTICSLPVALHVALPGRSYFQLSGGKHRQGGTFTLRCALAPKRTSSAPSGRGLHSPSRRALRCAFSEGANQVRALLFGCGRGCAEATTHETTTNPPYSRRNAHARPKSVGAVSFHQSSLEPRRERQLRLDTQFAANARSKRDYG